MRSTPSTRAPRLPESPLPIVISVALVASLLASMALALLAIGWYAFGQSEPQAYLGYGIASVCTAIGIPLVAIVAWYIHRRKLDLQGVRPPSSPLLTAFVCLPFGCLVTAYWVGAILEMARSL